MKSFRYLIIYSFFYLFFLENGFSNDKGFLNQETINLKNKLLDNYKFKSYYPKYSLIRSKIYYAKLYDDDSKKFASLVFDGINFRIFSPEEKFRTTRKLPLVVYYHGSGAHGNDNIKPIVGSIKKTAKSSFQKENPCFVIVPQCPKKKSWTNDTLNKIMTLVKEVEKSIPEIDSNRKYLMGHSLGGFGVCHTIKKFPKYFTAAVPMAGAIGTGFRKDQSIPILAVYNGGEMDIIKNASKNLIKTFKSFGEDAYLKKITFGGHKDTLKDTLNNKKLMSWVFSKSKSNYF